MPVDDINSIIPSIKLHPFPTILHYNFDGKIVIPDQNVLTIKRTAYMECPICKGLDDFYSCERNAHYSAVHCPGNQPPEHEHQDILGNKHKHIVNCSGITQAHFHVKCNCCDQIFFVSLPERS